VSAASPLRRARGRRVAVGILKIAAVVAAAAGVIARRRARGAARLAAATRPASDGAAPRAARPRHESTVQASPAPAALLDAPAAPAPEPAQPVAPASSPTRRGRLLAVRVGGVVAAVAALGAIALLSRQDDIPKAPPVSAAVLADPGGDADGDGVANREDLAPMEAGPRATPTAAPTSTPRRGTAADRHPLLRLAELDVRYRSARVASGIGSGADRVEARGVFVVVSLRVRNKLDDTAQFDPAQVELILGRSVYDHDATAETVITRSFGRTGGEIESGQWGSGVVVFDVPPARARELDTDGTIRIRQFTDMGGTGAPTRGLIRTDE
jgi:hypothetical protein